jgi:hypothetical protein
VEKFSAYGFQLEILDDWRIEFNAKNNREKGDVALHSPSDNVFFVSWGRLQEAQRRYGNLKEHRDGTVERIRKDPMIQKADIVNSETQIVSTHEGLLSKVVLQRRRGFMARVQAHLDIWSVHFYCPAAERYYIVYWHVKAKEEYPEAETLFLTIVRSWKCHL